MSRVQIDPRVIQTINEDGDTETRALSSHALAEHERQNPPLGPPKVQRGRRSTVEIASSDKSSSDLTSSNQKERYKLNKRAFDVTRRLSVSTAMFSQLGLLAKSGLPGLSGASHSGDVKYENTYRLEPKEDESFLEGEVSAIAEGALRGKLADVTYGQADCAKLVCSLTNIIKTRVRENLELPRYKIVVNVVIGENQRQSIQMASRCIWDENRDRFATASYKNSSLFAVATVHGIYMD